MICEHCNGKVYARCMCEKLYRRWKRNGTTVPKRRRLDGITFIHEDDRVGIPLTHDLVAWVDAADFPLVQSHVWRAVQRGYTWYAVSDIDGPVYMHDLIMKPGTGLEVDHRNGSGLVNCRWNLRNCTHQINMQNSRRCHGQACLREAVVLGERV